MDYFKELQGFADRIRSIEPGTYFSRLYQTDRAADDEQRQIISLLQELQLAMESPSLLSAPPEGAVLHLGTADKAVDAALSHLCVALEKCLFFGAEGSMPDFWWVLDRASEDGSASFFGGGSGGVVGGDGLEGPSLDAKGNDVDGSKDSSGASGVRTMKPPEPLAASIHLLTRVHAGHARCRAWARGLLGIDGAVAEGELRKAAASVAHLATTRATPDEPALRVETGDNQPANAHAAGTAVPSPAEEKVGARASESDPDAGGGVGRSLGTNVSGAVVSAAPVDLPTNDRGHDLPFSSPPMPPHSSLLPLWLRPNAKGSSILDDVCRSLAAFSRQLDERGLSIRPSLNHAWLDQESLAAVTTYTWPSFRRTRLRCYVRGAGLSTANGEYLPSDTGEGDGGGNDGGATSDRDLTLLGPNGCTICRNARGTSVGQRAVLPAVVVGDAAGNLVEESTDEGISGRAVTNGETGATAALETTASLQPDGQAATPVPAAPEGLVARLWHLLVPEAGSSGSGATKSAYYCLGDGPLPPSRGWRSAGEAEAPAPVLRFATQPDDAGFVAARIRRGGREDHHQVQATEEEGSYGAALFRAALPLDDVGAVMTEGASAVGTAVVAAGAYAETDAMGGSNTSVGPVQAAGRGRLKQRRKRRRPADGVEAMVSAAGRESPAYGELAVPQGRQAKVISESDAETCGGGGGGGDCGGRGRADGGSNASADDGRCAGCERGDEDVAAFKAERWRLPESSGELLSRVERSREQLQRAIEESTLSLAMRRRQLQDEIALVDQEFQAVLKESTDTTVGRVLAARPHLREEAEVEVAVETATAVSSGGGGDLAVPSLEELVAEKAEALRTRLHSGQGAQEEEEEAARLPPSPPPSSAEQDDDDSGHPDVGRQQPGGGSLLPVVAVADAGWPWPADWLAAPRVPPPPPFRDVDVLGLALEGDFVDLGAGGGDRGRLLSGAEDGGGASGPPIPYSIEVAAVEVADAEDPEAAHIEYVLRVVYRERAQETTHPVGVTPSVMPETREREPKGSGGAPCAAAVPKGGDQGATDLLALVTAAKGLLQRTRVLSKRLNSLCAIHPQLMWELEEARRLRPEAEGGARIQEVVEFPDPFELGTLEESILRVHRDKLTPRFKANSPTRKLSLRVGTYLSGLLHFLGVLEAVGATDVRSRMAYVLNDALSTCDRVGRKRRRGDFVLSSRVEDVAGGRLGSGGGDEERLRVQKRSCLGCGRAIAAEFLGIKKDYSPCRFADGLFCRSYCHAEDRRVIPHRVVHHWDFATHRVCRDARAFLDATRFLPVFDLPELSPTMFADHESLRTARSRRTQLHLLRRAVFSPPQSKCPSGARLFDKLLAGRMHLAVSPGLYSLEDLLGVKNGSLLDFLEETNEVLSAHVMDGCDVCEARAACVCDACGAGDPIFAFQIEKVTQCSKCERLFHAKCVERQAPQHQRHHQQGKPPRGSGGSSKRWLNYQAEASGNAFVCLKCEGIAPVAEAVGE